MCVCVFLSHSNHRGYRPTPATLGLSTTNRRTSTTSRSPVSTISKTHHHLPSTISKHYSVRIFQKTHTHIVL